MHDYIDLNWLNLAVERNLRDHWIQCWHSEQQEKGSCSTNKLYKGKYECERIYNKRNLYVYILQNLEQIIINCQDA